MFSFFQRTIIIKIENNLFLKFKLRKTSIFQNFPVGYTFNLTQKELCIDLCTNKLNIITFALI